jgi:hypothetical protein
MIWDDSAVLRSSLAAAEDTDRTELFQDAAPICLRHRLAWRDDLSQAAGDVVLHSGEVLGSWHVRPNVRGKLPA